MRNLVLILCLALVYNFSAAQKMVLFEKFTNAYCGVCPDATIKINDIVEEYPNTIWISHHKPVNWTTNPLTNDQSIAIYNELNVLGVPQGMIDRKVFGSSITQFSNVWRQHIESQLQEDANFEIEIANVSYDANNRDLDFEVITNPNASVTNGTYRITVFIVESPVWGVQQHSYFNDVEGHPLEGLGDVIWAYPHKNVVRTILEDHWGTADVVPENPLPGTDYTKTYSYNIPEEFVTENIKVVAMISLFNEDDNYPDEVQNSTQIQLNETGLNLTSTENISPSKVEIAPNPASEFVQITFDALPNEVVIFDAAGKLIQQFSPQHIETKVDLTSYKNGNYFVLYRTKDQNKVVGFSVFK